MELQKKLSEFTDEELVQEEKKRKQNSIYRALGIGFMVGVAFYSAVRNGFSFITIAIIAFVLLVIYKSPNDKEVREEMESRKSDDGKIS